jgi:hypothetical protein
MPNFNAEIIKLIMRASEKYVRITVVSPGGSSVFPSKGCAHPDTVPGDISGRVLVDFFDASRYPTRKNEQVTLPGNAALSAQQASPAQATYTGTPNPVNPSLAQISQHPQSLQTQIPPSSQPSAFPLSMSEQTTVPTPSSPTTADAQPDLAREIKLAQISQLRSDTLLTEEAAGSAIEREKLAIVRDSQYTREVAEWQQLGSSMRRELYATQSAYLEKAHRQFNMIDSVAHRMLHMSDEVATRLKSPLFQPAPPPPLPPPPPPNYAAIAVAGLQALQKIAVAWSPRRKSKSKRKTGDPLRSLIEMLDTARKQEPQAPPAQVPTTDSDKTERHESQPDDSVSISAEGLRKLIVSGILSSPGRHEALAEALRDNKLDAFIRSLGEPKKG